MAILWDNDGWESGRLGVYWLQNEPDVATHPHPVRVGDWSSRHYLHRYNSTYNYKTMFILLQNDAQNWSPGDARTHWNFDIGSEYWIGMSIYVRSPWEGTRDMDWREAELVWQFQALPDAGEDYRSPVLALYVGNDRWVWIKRWDSRATSPPGNSFEGSDRLFTEAVSPYAGTWVDFVINVKWEYDSTGFINIWRNGTQIVADIGPNCSNDDVGPFMSFGPYVWTWRDSSWSDPCQERLWYFDSIKIGDENATYNDVVPGGGTTTTTTTTSTTLTTTTTTTLSTTTTTTLSTTTTTTLPGTPTDTQYGVVSDEIPTSTGTQDLVDTDLGGAYPKAAWFLVGGAGNWGGAGTNAILGVGTADGTREWACCATADNAESTSRTYRRGCDDKCIQIINPTDGSVIAEAEFVAWVSHR